MKLRRVVSLGAFLSFSVMVLTGVVLFICPQGRVAYWTGWRLLGLSKEQYGALHATFMVVFMVAGIWHIVLNWSLLARYLKNRARQTRILTPEFNVALGVTVLFVIGTLTAIPPWSTYLGCHEQRARLGIGALAH